MYALYDATVVATHSHTRAPPADMLALADKGDNSSVDMLVGDIYGQDYQKIGLKSSTIASSFGKVFRRGEGHDALPKILWPMAGAIVIGGGAALIGILAGS